MSQDRRRQPSPQFSTGTVRKPMPAEVISHPSGREFLEIPSHQQWKPCYREAAPSAGASLRQRPGIGLNDEFGGSRDEPTAPA